ncbi:MAG: hypothetical protein Ta2D_10810 [Rickettsiales bacterium]|nr:MAG: hypothetical protein Ta2D_10810 [Rickettsiales bacterium]
MVKVSLISKSSENALNLISHSAKVCYSPELPKIGNLLDVENQLFNTGHHTTLQHNYYTFSIDEISISTTTFGLNFYHPFYNADQRSGRYSKMYVSPDYDEIKNKILTYFPDAPIEKIIDFIKKGRNIYKDNMKEATNIAFKLLKEERPFAKIDETMANKIAQEQMRLFISTIMDTGLNYTINLSALSAFYATAWTPELKDVVEQMKNEVLKVEPELAFVFKNKSNDIWYPELDASNCGVYKKPQLHSIKVSYYEELEYKFDGGYVGATDIKQFSPKFMNNNLFSITEEIEVSLVTMAQDQRHRTLKRSEPKLSGNFYLAPIPALLGLEEQSLEYMKEYADLYNELDKSLAVMLAPYGVMAKYKKVGNINAILHEQAKRLCWTAQEEIYNLSRDVQTKLMTDFDKKEIQELAKVLYPACYNGECIEGKRYCGRDIKVCKSGITPERKV